MLLLFGRKKLKILLSTILVSCIEIKTLLLVPAVSYAQKFKELVPYLQQIGYTDDEINSIEKIVEEAVSSELPEKYLCQRIKEGISKKVEYIMLYTTLIDRISKLRIAKVLITKLFREDLRKDMEYSVTFLSELLEAGFPIYTIVKLGGVASSANVSSKEFVGYVELLKIAKLNKVPEKIAINIISEAISKKQPYKEAKERIVKARLQCIKEEITKEYTEKKLINR